MHVSTDTVKNVRPGPVPQRQKDTAFHQLTRDLNSIMAHSPGSDFSDIDPQPIISLMEGYASKASDWLEYAYRDKDQCFTRNLVDRGNGKCNLVGRAKQDLKGTGRVDGSSLSLFGARAKKAQSMTTLGHIVS